MGTVDVAKIGVASNMETSSRVDTSQNAHHIAIEDANKNASANVLGNTHIHTSTHTRKHTHTPARAQTQTHVHGTLSSFSLAHKST